MNSLSENSKEVQAPRDSIRATDLPSRKLGVREAAAFLNVSKSWLDKRRVFGGGPRYMKFGRRVNYSIADLEDFAARNRRQHTSEQTR